MTDVTLVIVDIKSERFIKRTSLQQDLFDMTMVTIRFDTKSFASESFIDGSIEGIVNITMEFHHFRMNMTEFYLLCQMSGSL